MYICQVTGRQSKSGQKLNKLVVQTRPKTYTRWIRNEDTREWEEIEIGRGFETVREVNASQEGVDLWNSWSPEERELFLKRVR